VLTSEEVNRLAYKDMRPTFYWLTTLTFYLIVVIGAIHTPQVTFVLDMLAATTNSAFIFVIPGLFYWRAAKQYGVQDRKYLVRAKVFIFLGFVNFTLSFTSLYLGMKEPVEAF